MLKVKTLGCLQLIWDGQPVSLGKQAGNNIAKLFVILALQGEQGIPRRELIRQLFYQQSAEFDTGANLRITVYRLRRALKNAGIPCPEGEDYILSGRGLYRWNPSIPLSVDVVEFRDLAAKAEAAAKQIATALDLRGFWGSNSLSAPTARFTLTSWPRGRTIRGTTRLKPATSPSLPFTTGRFAIGPCPRLNCSSRS